eukprot:gene12636-15868_t
MAFNRRKVEWPTEAPVPVGQMGHRIPWALASANKLPDCQQVYHSQPPLACKWAATKGQMEFNRRKVEWPTEAPVPVGQMGHRIPWALSSANKLPGCQQVYHSQPPLACKWAATKGQMEFNRRKWSGQLRHRFRGSMGHRIPWALSSANKPAWLSAGVS